MEENPFATPVEVEAVDTTDDDKLWALLSWIVWPVAVVALLMDDKKERPFVKYNAVMSLIVGLVASVVGGALSFIIVGCFIGGGLWIYQIYLGIQAYQGKWVEVPWLTDFVKKQGWAWAP